MLQTIFLLHTVAHLVAANVEKIIFTGPPPSRPPSSVTTIRPHPLLNIHTLTHDAPALHTELSRVFASEQSGLHGQSTWISVQNLTENQRYELR
ncbi:hypothetical protein E4U55_000147, partial [Claviceps digitariae]